jgi:hypothetical protein
VGHGALLGRHGEYCLLLQDTRAPSKVDTSLRVSSLMSILRDRAPRSSRVLFLDCCFAGLAASHVQGGAEQAAAAEARRLAKQDAGDPGVAIAAAASARMPARIADPATYTIFSQALMQVLWSGDPQTAGSLSLRRIVDLTYANLVAGTVKDPPRPELHVPDQTGGDLGALPLFPNRAQPAAPTPQPLPPLDKPTPAETHQRFVARLVEMLELARSGGRFHVTPDIPPRLLAAARRTHLILADENILAFVDLTLLRQGAQSAIFTDLRFRYRVDSISDGRFTLDLPYADLPETVIEFKTFSRLNPAPGISTTGSASSSPQRPM